MRFDWIHQYQVPEEFDGVMMCGHVVHRLEAFADSDIETNDRHQGFRDNEVGYINVTYIPKATWKDMYGGDLGILDWLSDFRSWNLPGDRNMEELIRLMSYKLDRQRPAEDVEALGLQETAEMFEELLSRTWERYRENYNTAREYHVDRPRVDYVCVDENHRRQGIGEQLYVRAARKLAEDYGMALHGSSLQSDYAKAMWKHLSEKYVDSCSSQTEEQNGRDVKKYKLDFR